MLYDGRGKTNPSPHICCAEPIVSSARAARLRLYQRRFVEILFAAFAAASALLASKGLNSKKHTGVIELFNLHFVKPGLIDKRFSKILAQGKQTRELSDYGDFYESDEQECRTQLQNAEQFVEMAINFLRVQGFEFTANNPFN